ncbi:carbohydrate kinase family protein [Paraburkholderia xenovorans]|uniref:carbohydrate kinase family protein n=1 Tax=Paraburkholderia xenovorans TaxID=36873 RepID=UPI0038BA1184
MADHIFNEQKAREHQEGGAWQLSPDDCAALRATVRSMRILVVGSLNVDYVLDVQGTPQDDGSLIVRSTTIALGGHAGNCASALARLGASVSIASSLGQDADGEMLREDLEARGISTTHIHTYADAATGRVFIPLFSDSHYMLMDRGANERLTAANVRAALGDDWDAIVVFDPSIAALVALFETLAWCTSPPKIFWTPGGLYARQSVVENLLLTCDSVLLNRHEYALVGSRVPLMAAGCGKPEIIRTLGAEGADLWIGGRGFRASAPHVTVIDPTGAGDAFAASYVAASLAKLAPDRRLGFANVAGALATTALGARGMQPTLDTLLESALHADIVLSDMEAADNCSSDCLLSRQEITT